MNWLLIFTAGIVTGCAAIYIFRKYDLLEKCKALNQLIQLTNDEVNEYLNVFETQWGEDKHGMDVIKNYASTPKDYANKIPLKGSDTEGDQTKIVYKILNMMCSLGNVKKMYIPPAINESKSLKENQLLLETEIANLLLVKQGDKVLDVGCGMGLIADYISDITQAEVHGLNVETSGIEHAQKIAEKKNRDKGLFKIWDYNKFPWPYKDNYFDAIYEVQAFTFMQDPERFFKELKRILKPGGRIVIDESALSDDFNADDEHHWELFMKQRPVGLGGNFWYYKYWEDIIKKTGFNLTLTKIHKPSIPLIKAEDDYFSYIEDIIKCANSIGLLPDHVCKLLRRLRIGADSMIRLEEIAGYRPNVIFSMTKPIFTTTRLPKKICHDVEIEKTTAL